MLRNKYIERQKGYEVTFKSVILAGVYDVKNLKLKFNTDEERKLNSPWNIATDFKVDMNFNEIEIESMLKEYEKDFRINMKIDEISKIIYKFTSGYPFLVSKICKTIDETLNKDWSVKGVEKAVKVILYEENTLFDDVIKNLENNKELYDLVWKILLMEENIPYTITDPIIKLGSIFGLFKEKDKQVTIHNVIFSQLIYNHMSAAKIRTGTISHKGNMAKFYDNGKLNMVKVLNKFQEIMHDEYREKDKKFIEREGRLLFLCFLKPIINGNGFYYVEPETRMDSRMDVVITYGNEEYIVELKIWHGDIHEKKSIKQIAG